MSREINLTLSVQEAEHLFDALEIYNCVETVVKEAREEPFSVTDPLAERIGEQLGWSDQLRDKRSDEICEILDEYNDLNFEDEFLMRLAEMEMEREIEGKGLSLDSKQRFEMVSNKYDEIRKRYGLPPKI